MAEALPQWRDYLATLAEADQVVDLLADPNDPQSRQDVYRLLFECVSSGYFSAFADPDLPDFVPLVNNVLNAVGVNPDFIYASAVIDGAGTYRLSGNRGHGLFLLFDFSVGGLAPGLKMGPSVGVLDIDTMPLAESGAFDVLLSAERPADYSGAWFRLDPRTGSVNIRQASYDWGAAAEARIAIERLDRPVRQDRLSAEQVAQGLRNLVAFPRDFATFALNYGKGQRARGVVNRLEHDDWAGRGGLAGQHYYQGIYRLEPGQALILETELPERVRYWNIQLNDPLWNTIDWLNHQSSLNGGQAKLDADGKFRAVICPRDPGVPNWLDSGGHLEGSLMLRWTEASSGPAPQLKLVPLADVRAHLPSSTPVVTAQQRQDSLRQRRRAAQWRRRW